LHAQREACEAFIRSQRHEGWSCCRRLTTTAGARAATLERPALQQLLAEIREGEVDVVVVYKIDRLTRSLRRLRQDRRDLDAKRVSFVSVTQQFNTTTSMGRLTTECAVVFAQFEREVTGEAHSATRSPRRRRRACGWAACRHSVIRFGTGS